MTGGGYLRGSLLGTNVAAHRVAFLIMTDRWPSPEVDHENGVRSDNRWSNLREATVSQNSRNRKPRSDNAVGFKGVSWRKDCQKWRAYICVDGKTIHLGSFDELGYACLAYVKAAEKHFGAFARFN